MRLHFAVRPDTGASLCGARGVCVPAHDVEAITCGRCLRDPEIAGIIDARRRTRAWHALTDAQQLAIIFAAHVGPRKDWDV